MSKAFSHERMADGKDEWLTPKWIVDAIGKFDLDPCSPVNRPWETAVRHLTQIDDGLAHDWDGRVWCNPPYGSATGIWMDRLANHGNGVALTFARTETKWFHESVWNRADSVFFFKGRLCFYHVDGTKGGTAGAPSCLISYGKNNMVSIDEAHSNGLIKGCHVILKSKDR